jgi:hypothetical protein
MLNTASTTDEEAAPGTYAPDDLEEEELYDYNRKQLNLAGHCWTALRLLPPPQKTTQNWYCSTTIGN